MRYLVFLSQLIPLALACQKEHLTDQDLGLTSRSIRREEEPTVQERATFPPSLTTEETILSNAFDNVDIDAWASYYTHGDHIAGKNKSQAQWTADKWSEFGVPSSLVEYEVLLSYPVSASLTLNIGNGTNGTNYEVTLTEDGLEEDETTLYPNSVPAFHGYSASGNASAEYVYAG